MIDVTHTYFRLVSSLNVSKGTLARLFLSRYLCGKIRKVRFKKVHANETFLSFVPHFLKGIVFKVYFTYIRSVAIQYISLHY